MSSDILGINNIFMNNIKKVCRNFVLSSDLLSHNVSLRHSGNSDYESYCTGFISIIAVSFFIVIFIMKLLSVLQLQDITAFEHLTDNLESSQAIQSVMFAMTIDGLGMSTIDKYFDFSVTEVTLSRPSGSNVSKTRSQKIIPLLPCKIDYWQDMDIENMDTIFQKRGMSAYYCPTQSFSIQGTSDEDTYIYSEIRLTPCAPTNPNCQNNAALRNQYYQNYVNSNQFFTVKLLMKDSIISPTNQDAVSNYLQKDILLTFSTTTGTIGYIQIADYDIETDTNILPWSQYESTTGYYIYRFQTSSVPSTTKFLYLKLQKSTRMFTVEREYGKIDDMLSYVGGLFGLIFYCVQFVMQSYNEYRYELSVGQVLFNYDDKGTQSKSDDMGFWTYVQYSVYEWFDFFGIQLSKWTSMKQLHETRQQTCSQIDVRYLMEKIRYLQNVVEVLITDQQRIGLLLTDLPTMNKIQKTRRVTQFYSNQNAPDLYKIQQKNEIGQNSRVCSQDMLNGGPNQTNYMINHFGHEELGRVSFDQNPVKQTVQNEGINKTDNSSELANQVSEALLKIMTNDHDPINKRIIQRLKPGVMNKIPRPKSNMGSENVHTINLIPYQKMRKNSK